jgi:hypothetical protein
VSFGSGARVDGLVATLVATGPSIPETGLDLKLDRSLNIPQIGGFFDLVRGDESGAVENRPQRPLGPAVGRL